MRNIQSEIFNKLDKTLQKQNSKNYNLNKNDRSLRDIETSKAMINSYIDKSGHYLKSADLLSELNRIEKGLIKIKSGHYEKGTFQNYKERALSELIKKNQDALNNRMIEIKAAIQKKEHDYNVKYTANPMKTNLENQRMQAKINLMDSVDIENRLQEIKNGSSYDSEIEISMLLDAVDSVNKNSWKKALKNLDPVWVDQDVKQLETEFNTLTEFPADMLPVKFTSDNGNTAITGVSMLDLLDDISQPNAEMVEV